MTTMRKNPNQLPGFTLLETVVALAILAFFLTLVIVNYHSYALNQLARSTSQLLDTDVQLSASHASRIGVSGTIQFTVNPDGWEVRDPTAMVQSRTIPNTVHVGLATKPAPPSRENPAAGVATSIIFPEGYWLGFGPDGETVNGQSAFMIVGTEGSWYTIAVKGFTDALVVGPTRRRKDIPLTDKELLYLLLHMKPATRWTTAAILDRIVARIRAKWGI